MNKRPNLFIAGAPKAGTSFLFQKLNGNPQLYFSKIKELNHFSYQDILKLGSYYKDFKISDSRKYLNFYDKSIGQKYLVDCSVSYFTFPEVPQKIKTFNPESKIVFILRNPIKRAFSHYNMDIRMGYASLPFKDYINGKLEYPVHFHQYIENSLYYKHISDYIKVFGKENICVLLLENIEEDILKLFKFLSISGELASTDSNEKVNQNKKPKNFISRTLQKNRALTSQLKMIVPQQIINKFNGMLYEQDEKKELMEEDYNILKQLFDEDIKQLNSVLEINSNTLWKI